MRAAQILWMMAGALASAVSLAAATRPAITGVSHIAVYTANPEAAERFYVHDLGGVKGSDPEDIRGVRYYFSGTQFVEVLPLPKSAGILRLDHIAFTTSNAEALRAFLAASGITVPAAVHRDRDARWFEVRDPESNRIQFVEPTQAVPVQPAANAAFQHIIHVGFIVHDRAREDRFFQKLLGFRPYWYGGNDDQKATWISQQVPDGSDWLEYMMVDPAHGQGIPEGMSQSLLGVFNHFSLGVSNIEAAYTLLWNGERLSGQDGTPKIGRDAKWQLNLHDPDGTRAEFMELHAIGKPCCSAFTATDPAH